MPSGKSSFCPSEAFLTYGTVRERRARWPHLIRREVSVLDLLDESGELTAGDDLLRVDHIAQGLGHLAAVLIADHRMQIDCSVVRRERRGEREDRS
jgi:hypothetical protein